jgi:type I restriction enzyme M protein
LGTLIDRVHRELSDEDIAKIADTYHAWKSGKKYADAAGFCKSATMKEIEEQGYVLTPGRYVGAADVEEDGEPFEEKAARLTKELEFQFEESNKLEKIIRKNLKNLTYGN